MHKKNIDVVVLSIGSPLKVGIYSDSLLIQEIVKEGKSSDVLPLVFRDIIHNHKISRVFYAKGPGSFMSIKIAYVFLKSFCILKKIKLFASDAFIFNNNTPIKSVGKSFFIKNPNGISIEKIENYTMSEFVLPKKLDLSKFSEDSRPMYIAPAV